MLDDDDARVTRKERSMTLEVSSTEKRATVWSARGPDRWSLAVRTRHADAAEAACALPLDVGRDAGTRR